MNDIIIDKKNLMHMDGRNLVRVGNKMNWKQTLLALGITNTTINFHIVRSINLALLGTVARKAKSFAKPWGIYADSQEAAKTLAVALGYSLTPEVHISGYYAHYHDGGTHHKIHIWFGKKVW